MRSIFHYFLLIIVIIHGNFLAAYAAENKEIESITVLTDPRLAAPLSELASLFARGSGISVANVFGVSADQEKKIEDGDSGDVFITSNPDLVQQLKMKGLVDVYSIGPLATLSGMHFIAAVVASENMTAARSFLDFIKSPEGRLIFKKNGVATP